MKTLPQRLTLPAARARIADLVWLKACDYKFAELAVKAYLDAGASFENPEKWTGCTHRYSRALQVAAALGKSRQLFIETLHHIETALQRHGPTDTSFLTRELMDIVFDHKRGDPEACAAYSAMAEGVARRVEELGDHYRAREYWAAKARWDYARNDLAAARASHAQTAESLVKEAELDLTKAEPSYWRAAYLVRQAVGVLDKLQPESRPRVEELRRLLAELAAKEAAEPREPLEPIDISEVVGAARKRVQGKQLPNALLALALITRVPEKAHYEAQLRQAMERGFLQFHFPMVVAGPRGTLVAAHPGVDPNDPDTDPLLAEMVIQVSTHYEVAARCIDFARETIRMEHDIREHHFDQLAHASSFVPPGREIIFARGLQAGMQGDFVTATHLLVPQLEHCIRSILKQRGENTLIINRKELDEERDLDRLLRLAKTIEVFGEDLCFTLRALLLHRFGPNLRNLLAHGLLEPEAASSAPGIYTWWLTLHLCYAPLLARPAAAPPPTEREPGTPAPNEALSGGVIC
jgi:hypothetical protein